MGRNNMVISGSSKVFGHACAAMCLHSCARSALSSQHCAVMPLYELLCLARPLLPREDLARMIHKVGSMVYAKGGVITNVHSYGEQNLAYRIKGVQGKYDKAQIWQLNFAVSPQALQEINLEMRVNEDILRWVVTKQRMDKLPSAKEMFHRLSEHAEFLVPPQPPSV